MAIRNVCLISIAGLLLVGCQSQQMAVSDVPPPNFNGPTITTAAPIAHKPAPVAPRVTPPQVAKTPSGVPKDWIPTASPRPWKWIVVHHSATPSGSATVFDRMHRDKGWDELGYDFVIGNGTNSGDGQIEVGPRWPKQKWGAHAKTPDNRFNERGIGICLVGNFDESRPTAAQMRSLARLTVYLMKTYRISPSDIIGHGETKATDCPGKFMSVAGLRRQVSQLAESGASDDVLNDAQSAAHLAIGESAMQPNVP